jgi:NAD-dependent dihydropyrimidine dehydrogenase PreA subunit
MEMRVNAEQCTGCGACVEICPNGAIRMSESLAVLDQTICSQCQFCIDACPVGAITAVELPVAVMKPAAVQPVSEAEIAVAEPVPSVPKPWLSAALAFVEREILPRLANVLTAALDRRLAQTQLAQYQASLPSQNAGISSRRNNERGYRRRSRFGQVRHRGRGQGCGAGKKNWL